MTRVRFFAGFDADTQTVLFRRERARGEWVVRTWRILRLVEVEDHLAVDWCGHVQEPRRGVRLLAARQVAEDEPEYLLIALGDRFHLQRLTVDRERDGAGHREVIDVAKDIRHLNGLWLRVGLIGGLHP